MVKINISKDFSAYPSGRYRRDSAFSGEAFRDELLAPTLEKNDVVEVMFDGSLGYSSSFLEEAFGGLVRQKKFSKETLHRKLKLYYKEDPILIEEIWQYIDQAYA
ncbi:STAS-like domain-containing protein [Pseudomonas yamanorum]|uniref:STAS-like domain-containing protein n=1 Tax=Pseudomonas yamanorum TaxID=515393 RepID=A0ABU1CRB9_9PSED|nr:STAS-like domain-containing protein [Pseudomonas yamanorum]MDR0189778.1 STAS-like domain-containing protein [Pseudomonas yamanorum]